MRYHKRAFTLVEMAVCVLIFGGLLTAGLRYYKVWTRQQAQETTVKRIDAINEALRMYVMGQSWLPCPAPLSDVPDSETFGQTTDCALPATPAGTFDRAGRGGIMVRIGTVPVRALNLPDQYMVDAWGRRFMYAVTKNMAHAPASNYRTNDGAIFLHDLGGNNIVDDGRGMYIIASHGISGMGGYMWNGNLYQPCVAAAADGPNCDHADATFAVSRSYSEANGTGSFDDVIRYDVKEYVPAPAISRYILDIFPCDPGQGGAASNAFGENCATRRFSGAQVYDPASRGLEIYSRTLKAQTDGKVMVRAVVPVIYDNGLISGSVPVDYPPLVPGEPYRWDEAIMGALEVDGTVISRALFVDPGWNSNHSVGWSGVIMGGAPIVKGSSYTVKVYVFSLGNGNVTVPSGWAGTIRHGGAGQQSQDGMIEIMEGAL